MSERSSHAAGPRRRPALGGGPGSTLSVGLSRLRSSPASWSALVPLILLWIVLAFASPFFLTSQNLLNLLLQASIVGVLALGITVALITEEIDLSIGALEGLTAVISATVVITLGLPWWLGIVAALGAGTLVGLANGLITTLVGVPSFITTLATLGIASGLALKITEGNSIYGFPTPYLTLGQGRAAGIPVSALIALAVLLVAFFTLRFTRLGLHMYAVGGNAGGSAEAGLKPWRIKTLALTFSGACAGLAGVLVSARLDAANGSFGENDLLDAIAAVVIGGTALTGGVGSVIGTAFGVLLIASIRNGLDLLGVSPFWQTAAVGAMILLAAILNRLAYGGRR
jgi:ribose/xylose/arabinose/galactoside ABC-type transport system permease subunit